MYHIRQDTVVSYPPRYGCIISAKIRLYHIRQDTVVHIRQDTVVSYPPRYGCIWHRYEILLDQCIISAKIRLYHIRQDTVLSYPPRYGCIISAKIRLYHIRQDTVVSYPPRYGCIMAWYRYEILIDQCIISAKIRFITTTQFYHNHSVLSQPLSICIVFSSLSAIVIVQCYTQRYGWISL